MKVRIRRLFIPATKVVNGWFKDRFDLKLLHHCTKVQ